MTELPLSFLSAKVDLRELRQAKSMETFLVKSFDDTRSLPLGLLKFRSLIKKTLNLEEKVSLKFDVARLLESVFFQSVFI